jgi:hypothetical protein
MRKLLAAGIIAAGSLGVSGQANAAEIVYEINGTFGSNEQGCTQIAWSLGGSDCTFGRNRPSSITEPPLPAIGVPVWQGPQFAGGHYAADGVKDQPSYLPAAGIFDGNTATFSPAADDGKIEAPITGTFTINDNDTPADPTDDRLSANFSIGAMARNFATGASTRAVQRWTTMDHVMASTPVNATATVSNGSGGADYVIGSRGFPARLCSATNGTDCLHTSNSSFSFQNFDADEKVVAFWAEIPPGSIGIERSSLLGDPTFAAAPLPKPPGNPPNGNVGATTSASFTGYSCTDTQANDLDCTTNTLVWQNAGIGTGGEPIGFDNMIMKISTNGAGQITSALVYWTEEYFIGAFGGVAGYDNSWQGGTFSFTGEELSAAPNARDFAVTVIEETVTNTLDTVANSRNIASPITVTIVTPPSAGVATVNGDQTLNYNATGVGVGTQTIVYETTDGTATDQGTITVTVAADVPPVAPDGAITISTQGAAPGAATVGQVDVATLTNYSPGNGLAPAPNGVAITTAPDPAKGTATVTGTTIRFTPAATFFAGTATIGYTLTDINGDTDSGEITVTIADLTPVVSDGTITTDQDTASPALALGITPGNGSVAQHTLTVSTAATSGTCSISGTSLTYTPNAEFFGSDSCVVTITDGDGESDTGTISITVNEVSNELKLPGGGSAVDLWSLSLLGALPLLRRRRRA